MHEEYWFFVRGWRLAYVNISPIGFICVLTVFKGLERPITSLGQCKLHYQEIRASLEIRDEVVSSRFNL